MKAIWRSFSIIFGVVPEAMSECHPETAPQAMVMNRNGNTLPAQTGPLPSMNLVTAGICRSGRTMMMPTASNAMVPILRKVEIIARRQQQPDWEHGGDEPISDD